MSRRQCSLAPSPLVQAFIESLENRLFLNGGGLATGLLTSAQDQAWLRQNMPLSAGARLNDLGLSRINAARAKKGQAALTWRKVGGVARGDEPVLNATANRTAATVATQSQALASGVPSVDNSQLSYFPAIGNQGGLGACVAWATTYYAMTYMTNFARGTAATDNDHRYSPKWTYDLINGGADAGAYFSDAYNLMLDNGAATYAEAPYDTNYRDWVYKSTASYKNNTETAAQVWRNAIGVRLSQQGSISNVLYSLSGSTGLDTVKTYLVNGYVLNFGCYIYSWQFKTVGNDPGTTADDPYVGQQVCYYTNGSSGAHAMTIVGYNDDIWTDINGNGTVDPGEKGALKIANSWGTGQGNSGYYWLAYDALNLNSVVSGAPTSGRSYCLQSNLAYWVTARSSYTPTALAEFTLKTGSRSDVTVALGTGAGSTPTGTTWTSSALNYAGGAYGFDGNTYASSASAPAGTFVLDYTGLNPSLSSVTRYFLRADDSTDATHNVTLSSFRLTDAAGNTLASDPTGPRAGDLPIVDADGTSMAAWAISEYPGTEFRGTAWNDLNNNNVKDAGELGIAGLTVFADANGDGVPDYTDSTATPGTSTPTTISRSTTVTSSLDASSVTGTITDVNVTFHITFTSDTRLSAQLVSPSGTTIQLFNSGLSGANFTNTVLDDQAGSAITSGSGPFVGTFRPAASLSGLNGLDASGTWQLRVTNRSGSITGTIDSWSLSLATRANENVTTTDSTGAYVLTRNVAGTYDLRIQPPTGYGTAYPAGGAWAAQTIAAQQIVNGMDFAELPLPPTPAGLAAAMVSSSAIRLTWTDVTGETGYLVERSPDGTNGWTQVASLAANAIAYTDGALSDGTTYYYRLRASNSAGNSPASTTASATTRLFTGAIGAVSPNPCQCAIGQLTITFSDPVSGFELDDLTLTRDGTAVPLSGASLSGAGTSWTLSGLSGVTGRVGAYQLTLNAAGVSDAGANALSASAVESWAMAGLVADGDVAHPNDSFTMALDSTDAALVDISYSNGSAADSYSAKTASLASLALAGGAGNDALTLDFSRGDFNIPGGITFDGGAGTNTLRLIGASSTDPFTVTATSATRGSASVAFSGIEKLDLSAGAFAVTGGVSGMSFIIGGGSLAFAASQDLAGLSVGANGVVLLAQSAGTQYILTVPNAALAVDVTGKIDLANNSMVVTALPDGSDHQAVADRVRGLLQAGRNGGAWDGHGIASSTIAVHPGTALGYLDGGSRATIKYTWAGDASLDQAVNFNDLLSLAQHYGTTAGATWATGDFNYDGIVNFNDLLALAQRYEALPAGLP